MFFQGEFSDFSVESGRKGRPSEVKKKLQTDRPHQSRTRYNTHNFLRGPPPTLRSTQQAVVNGHGQDKACNNAIGLCCNNRRLPVDSYSN